MTSHARRPTLALLFAILAPALPAQDHAILSARDIHHPVWAAHGMVATQEASATRIGVDVLERGGNAVDAAVAIGFALAVTLPRAGNLGGGGFMLVHDANRAETAAVDYREVAPAAASADMFLDGAGEVDSGRSRFTHLSAGVPGTVAGLALAHARWGSLAWADLLAPAIALASDGIVVTRDLADSLDRRRKRLAGNAASAAIFLRPDGSAWQAGETLVQADLAASLRAIATGGPDAFYRGPIAERIAADMERHGGLVTAEDLAGYRALVRAPVTGAYRGHVIASMPPPSSGGVHLVQMLNVLERFPIGFLGHNTADTVHLMAETMKLAYADRSQHLGDPDHWKVPVGGLVSKSYAGKLATGIDLDRARPSASIAPGDPTPYESEDTTHFSIMDGHGNAVANTYTINFSYGSGIVAAGTGILLNNEMDDFSAKPGVPNAYGLVGGEANAIAPGKRPLSSMTPTLVMKDGKPLLATGSPGGSRIITTVLQVVMNVVDHGMNVAAASAAPRFHHQWLPDELRIEHGFSLDTLNLLAQRGHTIVEKDTMGSTQSIVRGPDGLYGASDPRRPEALTLGY